ncbi:hypothetical protein [Parasitella parasitica]|uniref:HMG box domain-containing protein n=1 Tax=Parasitella parasitica TaxID=35722 RepID=A0A0B7NF10_9FUNG|nr:hypothetical protein [Parasitella parasitica]
MSSTQSNAVELAPINQLTCLSKITTNNSSHLPAFLEPVPTTKDYRYDIMFVPRILPSFSGVVKDLPPLVPSSASSVSSDTSNPSSPPPDVNNPHQQSYNHTLASQIPSRNASLLPSIQPKPVDKSKCLVEHRPPSLYWPRDNNNVMVDAFGSPLSPTTMAAAAAATVASAQNFAKSLTSLSLSAVDDNSRKQLKLLEDCANTSDPSKNCIAYSSSHQIVSAGEALFTRRSFMAHGSKCTQTNADRRMFLTKNAHIKRPRNAWIHFRCHYGQALKSTDPTLRAEEISKRASHRWARLSENEKKPWHDLAEQDKQAHKAAFPEYRYCPRRSNTAAILASKNQQEDNAKTPGMHMTDSSRV